MSRRAPLAGPSPHAHGVVLLCETIAPMSASTGTSAPAEERLLTALQTATDRLIHYATRGTAKQVEPPLTEALSEVEGFCAALEAFLAHGFKTRQFLLFTVHPWAFVEHSEKFGELNAEAVRPYTSPMPPLYLPYTSPIPPLYLLVPPQHWRAQCLRQPWRLRQP